MVLGDRARLPVTGCRHSNIYNAKERNDAGRGAEIVYKKCGMAYKRRRRRMVVVDESELHLGASRRSEVTKYLLFNYLLSLLRIDTK